MSQRKRLSSTTAFKRATLLCLSIVTGVTLFSAPASAEGSWSSYFSGVIEGFQSRRWTDNDSDADITRNVLTGCRVTHNGAGMGWELLRHRAALPDASYGDKDYESCDLTAGTNSERESWSSPGTSGEFYLQVSYVSSGSAYADEQYVAY